MHSGTLHKWPRNLALAVLLISMAWLIAYLNTQSTMLITPIKPELTEAGWALALCAGPLTAYGLASATPPKAYWFTLIAWAILGCFLYGMVQSWAVPALIETSRFHDASPAVEEAEFPVVYVATTRGVSVIIDPYEAGLSQGTDVSDVDRQLLESWRSASPRSPLCYKALIQRSAGAVRMLLYNGDDPRFAHINRLGACRQS